MEEMEIRLAEPEDAEELLAIYAPYVEETSPGPAATSH